MKSGGHNLVLAPDPSHHQPRIPRRSLTPFSINFPLSITVLGTHGKRPLRSPSSEPRASRLRERPDLESPNSALAVREQAKSLHGLHVPLAPCFFCSPPAFSLSLQSERVNYHAVGIVFLLGWANALHDFPPPGAHFWLGFSWSYNPRWLPMPYMVRKMGSSITVIHKTSIPCEKHVPSFLILGFGFEIGHKRA